MTSRLHTLSPTDVHELSNENDETIELDELIYNDSEEELYIERRMSHGWRPKYLRRRVIIAFNIIFTILIVTLEVLNGISIREQGFVFAGVDVFNVCRMVIPAGTYHEPALNR